jgi:hypothetical protein
MNAKLMNATSLRNRCFAGAIAVDAEPGAVRQFDKPKTAGFPALQNMDTNQVRHLLKRSQWLHESAKRILSDLLAAGADAKGEPALVASDAVHATFALQEQLQFALAAAERSAPAPILVHSLSGKSCSACGDIDGCHAAEAILRGGNS